MARIIKLFQNRAFEGNEGEEQLIIPKSHEYLAFYLSIRAENLADGNAADGAAMNTIESCISEINIQTDQETLKEFSGEMCRTLATYKTGKLPHTLHTQANGTTYVQGDPTSGWSENMFPIHFNDPVRDPYGDRTKMMLPAPLYDSLVMNINYDFPTTSTKGFYDGGQYKMLSLHALVRDKEDVGSMMNRNVLVEAAPLDHTTLATGNTNHDLTIEPGARLLAVTISDYLAGISEGVGVTDVAHKVNGVTQQLGKWGDIQSRNAIDCNLAYRHRIHAVAIGTDDELWTRIPAVYGTLDNVTDPANNCTFLEYTADDKVTLNTAAADDVNVLNLKSDVLPRTVVLDYNLDGNSLVHGVQLDNARTSQLVLTNGSAGHAVQIIESILKKPMGTA